MATPSLASLPNELKLRILQFADIPSLKNIRFAGREWKILAEDPSVWTEIRSRMGTHCFKNENHEDSLWARTLSCVKHIRDQVLDLDIIPKYIQSILKQKSDESNTKILSLWLQARDTNKQWDIVSKKMELPIFSLDDISTAEEEISLSDLFPLWTKQHKTILQQLLRIRFNEYEFLTLTPQIYRFNCVQELYLQENRLEKIPDQICLCTSLITLDISENKLTSLPKKIGKLTQLEILILGDNRLTELPKSMAKLSSLRMLDLGFNQLNEIPPFLEKLTSLEGIELQNNSISTIPDRVSQCPSLTELSLTDNHISSVPASLGAMRSLQYLLLDGNKIKTLPREINNIPHVSLGFAQGFAVLMNKITKNPEQQVESAST